MAFDVFTPSAALQELVSDIFVFTEDFAPENRERKIVTPNGFATLLLHFGDLNSICYNHLGEGHHNKVLVQE